MPYEFDPTQFKMSEADFSAPLDASMNRMAMAADTHQKAALTLQQIRAAQDQHDKAVQDLDLDKKQKMLDLEKAKASGRLTNIQADMMEQAVKDSTKPQEAILDAHQTLRDHAEHAATTEAVNSAAIMKNLYRTDPVVKDSIHQVLGNLFPMTGGKVDSGAAGRLPNIPAGSQILSSLPPQGMIQAPNAAPAPTAPAQGDGASNGLPEKSAYQSAQDKMNNSAPEGYQINPAWISGGAKPEDMWIKSDKTANNLSINALRISDTDKSLLEQVYAARKSGQSISKDDVISQMSPELASSVQGLVDYNDDPSMYGTRNNARAEIVRIARLADPTYDPTKYAERRKYRLELASESSFVGKQKIALNTVAQHIAQLDSYIDDLGGGNIKPVNMVINFAKDLTGNSAIATYDQASEAVNSEMQRLLTGVGVTQAGMAETRKIVSRDTGYEAKKAALRSLVKIVEGRISPLKQSFKMKMGRDENGEIVFPETQAIFDKYLTGGGSAAAAGENPEISAFINKYKSK